VSLVADVADADSVAAAVEEFGELDVAVANAGITHYRPFAQLPLDEARHMNDVNWLGTIYTVWAALPGMIERGRGHIVIVSSGGGVRGFPSAAVYNGTKAAQRGFAEALRHELAGTGVSVTTVYPGEIATSLHDHELEHMPDWYRMDRRAPAEPLGEQVVEAVENDQRELFYPPLVRMLRIANGLSPRLGDLVLRRILGRSAAPR
jgi:short-subunit dehydrogenase